MTELLGKRALVTGASRGIGAGIALALADKGADVAITYERSADRAAEVVRAIEAKGRRAIAIQADSADADAVQRSVAEAVAALGGIDILVNNAGIARYSSVADLNLADIDALLAVNVRSAVLATGAAIPHLGEGGRVITIGSCLAERVPFAGSTLYSMTKSALLAFTRGLARDLGAKGITANLVQPGPIDTDMNPADGDRAADMVAVLSLPHYGQARDIAGMVAFLAGPEGRYVTGASLAVDGGYAA